MTMKLKLCSALIGILLSVFSHNTQAHLMAPNKGTLNFDKSGGYLVLSLPVSTLMGFDKDKNKILTIQEIKSQQKEMIEYVTESLYLKSEEQRTFLSGTMLAPQKNHDVNNSQIEHIVIIGKFLVPLREVMSIHVSLLNSLKPNEKLTITMTEKGINSKQIFSLDNTYAAHTFEE